ncbi:hypothetical protein AMTR_s00141p00080100 [Amborella trichopoda]|uniref:Uncharacterized protein n=1 Tax=Amborella trichopoda TaxID=13333 RepID=W1PAS5_AMBTC|nr:hypothetical protein AMTR_s00141p00080100 [Amborella trichopoda]
MWPNEGGCNQEQASLKSDMKSKRGRREAKVLKGESEVRGPTKGLATKSFELRSQEPPQGGYGGDLINVLEVEPRHPGDESYVAPQRGLQSKARPLKE